MKVHLFVERNAKNPALWNGFIQLTNYANTTDAMIVRGEYNHQSPNGAWDEIITALQRAIDQAEIDAPGTSEKKWVPSPRNSGLGS